MNLDLSRAHLRVLSSIKTKFSPYFSITEKPTKEFTYHYVQTHSHKFYLHSREPMLILYFKSLLRHYDELCTRVPEIYL